VEVPAESTGNALSPKSLPPERVASGWQIWLRSLKRIAVIVRAGVRVK
jgi:hypothetical protein